MQRTRAAGKPGWVATSGARGSGEGSLRSEPSSAGEGGGRSPGRAARSPGPHGRLLRRGSGARARGRGQPAAPPLRPLPPGPAPRCPGPAGRSVPDPAGPRGGHRRGSNRRPGGWQRGQRAPGHLRTQVSGGRAGAGRRGWGRGAERRGSRGKARKGPWGGRGTQSPRREDYWEGARETRNVVVPCS